MKRGIDMKKNTDGQIRFGIKLKLSLFVILLVVFLNFVITSILTTSITTREIKSQAEQMLSNMNLSIDYLSSTAADGMVTLDDLLILNIVKKVSGFKNVSFAFISDKKNITIAHSAGFEKNGEKLADPESLKAADSDEVMIQPAFNPGQLEKKYLISAPIKFRSEKIGTAFISYSTESIFQSIEVVKKNILFSSLLVMLGTILLGITGSIIIASFTTRPIKTLVEGIRIIGQGNLDHEIKVESSDELGYLSVEFNKTTLALKEYQNVLIQREGERSQLELAKKIQNSLIPQTDPSIGNINVANYFKTVFGVGGDYYDFFPIGKDRLGVIICDVVGKGMPASLVMVMIRTLVHSFVDNPAFDDPAAMINEVNKRIALDFKGEQYATLFFIIVNHKTGAVTAINAGHGNLLVFRRSENKFMSHDFGDTPVGVIPEQLYTPYETSLIKGDIVILNTDGITEAGNSVHEQFTEQRLNSTITKNMNFDAKKILDNTIKEVENFTGSTPQHDDMTLILLEYIG